MAHNVLAMHAQLSIYPETTFFVSPIPICIASIIIMFAVNSSVETLAWGLSKEDVHLSLKLYPLFRWRWLRRENTGVSPLIGRLAEKVFSYKFPVETGPFPPPILLDEMYWLTTEALRSKTPPSVQDVWNPLVPARATVPMKTGIDAAMHEHRPQLPLPTSLEEQQDRFITATARSPFAECTRSSVINIDMSGGAEHDTLNEQGAIVRSIVLPLF